MMKKFLYAAAVGTLVTGPVVAAPSAQAAARDGHCESGEFCLYYNSNHQGSVSDFIDSIPDYGSTQRECYEFRGAGAGQRQCVKNNAASAWNRTSHPVTVYFNRGYAGASQTFASGDKVNLNATLKNENASHRIGTTRTSMSYALYALSGGRITCRFDRYRRTPGHHEGIDIARSVGSPVHALVDGQVIRIARGARGPGSHRLSTIAIYNATLNRTIVYLHSAPLPSLSEGQRIDRGQRIATEDWRGISTSSAAHTHVEMRVGRQTHAAVSVGDPKLDNPNPTSFWNARGYDVR